MQADLRPWWKKLTNIGIGLVGLAGTLAPAFAMLGKPELAAVCTGVVALGALLGIKGAARRADRLREDAIAESERRDYR